MASETYEMKSRRLDPENPKRLRDALTALAAHSGAHVLRLEFGVQRATSEDAVGASMVMTVTHSMGPEREDAIGPSIAKVFFEAMRSLAPDLDIVLDEKETENGGDPR